MDCKNDLSIERNDDISGLGVIIGFVACGVLALLQSTVYYLFFYDPTQAVQTNAVDQALLSFRAPLYDWLVKRCGIQIRDHRRVQIGFTNGILALCDLQILLGSCSLLAGFIEINTTKAHYWRILVNIAWFSFITHQCALIFCTGPPLQSKIAFYGRLFLITGHFVLLLVATIPTLFFQWHLESNPCPAVVPVLRYADPVIRSEVIGASRFALLQSANFVGTVASLLYLIFSFITRVTKLSDSVCMLIRQKAVSSLGRMIRVLTATALRSLDRLTRHKIPPRLWYLGIETPLVTAYSTVRVLILIYSSALFDLTGVYFGCMVALYRLIRHKKDEDSIAEPESSFGFGQLLPVLLLITPIIVMCQSFNYPASGADTSQIETQEVRRCPEPEPKGYLLRLQHEERWKRLEYILSNGSVSKTVWFSPAAFGIFAGLLHLLRLIYTRLTNELFATNSLLIWILANELNAFVPLAMASVVVGVATAGWEKRPAKRVAWVCNVLVALWYLMVLIHDFHYVMDEIVLIFYLFDMEGWIMILAILPAVIVTGTYIIVCTVLCLIPRRWGWRHPILYEEDFRDSEATEAHSTFAPVPEVIRPASVLIVVADKAERSHGVLGL